MMGSDRILRRPTTDGTTEEAEETADRIMGEKFGIAAGRRLHLVVDTPGPNVARAPAPRSTRSEKYTIFITRRFR